MTSDVVQRVRRFNREWTEVLELLEGGLLGTDYSLTEARVLFELAHQKSWERQELRDRLDIDPSFLTRVVARLADQGLVASTPSKADGRRLNLALTAAGQAAFDVLDKRSTSQIAGLLSGLSSGQSRMVTEAMTILTKLVRPGSGDRQVALREMRPGDMGWVIQRHGEVYWDEFAWDSDFEGLVARIVADYHENHRPGRENAWVAEVDGARAGCVFCMQRDSDTAQLRILLVEPWARGLGIGTQLVSECVRFARDAGYEKIMLWTNDVLVSARRIYEAFDFELVEEERHHSFGHDLVGQNWELVLARTPS